MVKVIKKKKDDKTLLILAVIFVISFIVSGILIFNKDEKNLKIPSDARAMSYTKFLEVLEEGEVKTASISSETEYFIFQLEDDNKTYKTKNPGTEDFKEILLSNGVDVTDCDLSTKSTVTTIISKVFMTLMASYLICLAVVLVKFGLDFFDKDKAKEEKLKEVSFNDIVGLDEIKEELLFLVSLAKEDEKNKNLRLPRGILLEGPPGNGKTMIARDIATEAGMNFVSSSSDEIKSMYIGQSGKKLINLFKEARESAPCILFFDEIDALCSKRTEVRDSADKEINGVLNTFLTLLDGIEDQSGVVVIAATNMTNQLDPAVIRPGRFDKRFVINNPDSEARKKLFKKYLGDINDNGFDYEKLSSISRGLSCSGIENIVNEAKLIVAKEKREVLTEADLVNALRNYNLKGLSKKGEFYSEKEKKTVAIHESGHAIVAHFFCKKIVDEVSIIPTTSGVGGYTQVRNEENMNLNNMDEMFGSIVMLLSGKAAEEILSDNDGKVSTGSDNDITEATKLSVSYVKFKTGFDYTLFDLAGEEKLMNEAKKVMELAYAEAKSLLSLRQEKLEALSQELMNSEIVLQEKFLEIVSRKIDVLD